MTTDLTWMPAWQIAELTTKGEISAVEVLEHFIGRIEKLEPTLHAFHQLDLESARQQARRADQQAAEQPRSELGPLHGVPTAVMDGHMLAGFENPLWGIDSAEYDELFVERLREAGAILVGTTATYHWEPLDRPRNPWNLDRDSGNSSRGSAVAVAAGMLPIAIGMDGAGSTRLPASWSGVIGVNPSRGLVPHFDPVNPGLMLTSTDGPIARDARDAALVLQVMAGPDGRDFISTQTDPPDYLAHIDDGVDGLRLAWTDDFGWSREQWVDESAGVVDFARRATFAMADHGAQVEAIDDAWSDVRPAMFMLSAVNAGMGYTPPIDPESLAERQRRADEAWGWTGGSDFSVPAPDGPPTTADVIAATELRRTNWQTFRDVLSRHDVIISATTVMEPRTLPEWGLGGRHYTMTSYSVHTGMCNFLGLPAISVPCGFRNGLPVGLQVVALPGREDLALRVVRAIQQAHPMPRPEVATQ